jgi:16S rRNA (cytosine1402-N4)-methyltransferase
MASETRHIPVLLNEVLEALDVQPSDIVLDGTLGGGGHASAITEKLSDKGTFIGLDQDVDALTRSTERLGQTACNLILRESNFRNVDQVLEAENLSKVDKALFDLGWSSDQMADPERGLSFQSDGPLNMTLKKNPLEADVTAFDIVNHWQEETIADILYAFGDERYSRRIARGIVEAREQEPISTTFELVDIIKSSVPGKYRNGRIHPATLALT